MKTNYFSINTLDSEDKEQYKFLQKASKKLFNEIFIWFNSQESLPTFKSNITKYFVEKTGDLPETIDNIFVLFYRLTNVLKDKENRVDFFIEDLIKSYPDLIIDKEVLSNRIKKIGKVALKFELFYKIENTLSSGAETIKGSSISVVLKPVLKEGYDPEKTDIKDYNPEIIQYVPSIFFEMTRADNKNFLFQMTPENFEKFLNHLVSVQIELNAVRNGIKK